MDKHEKMIRRRIDYFDMLSGAFMLQIIVMHILQFAGMYKDSLFFSPIMHILFFYMVWFYFKSGYFYKTPENIDRSFFFAKFKKLLLPFFVFAAISFLIIVPFEIFEGTRPFWRIILTPGYALLRNGNPGNYNLPLWFLLSLFFTTIGFAILDRYRIKWIIYLFPFIGYFLSIKHLLLPLGLSNTFLGIFIFYMGYLLRPFENKQVLVVLSLFIYLSAEFFCFSSLDFRTNTLITGNYFLFIVSSICGILLTIQIGKRFVSFSPLNYIGKNSMLYFVCHWPIMMLVKYTFNVLHFETIGYIYPTALAISVFFILPFLVKLITEKFPYLLGR